MSLFPISRRRESQPVDTWNSLFDRFWGTSPFSESLPELFRSGSTPPLNIAEDAKSWTVSLEMPGLEEEDIDVQVSGNNLIVRAERRFEEEKEEKDFHRVEHQYGSIQRTVSLPQDLRTDAVDAVYDKGILTLTVPKVEPHEPEKIAVHGAR